MGKISKEELYYLYWDKGLTLKEIAEIYGVDKSTIRKWMMKYNISRRTRSDYKKTLFSRDDLYHLYWEKGLSLKDISKMYNISEEFIRKQMITFNIPRRKSGGRKQVPFSKNDLYTLYWEKEMSIYDIAKVYNVEQSTVRYWMEKYNIPRRKDFEGRVLKQHKNVPKIDVDEFLKDYIDGLVISDANIRLKGKTLYSYGYLQIAQTARNKEWIDAIKETLALYGVESRVDFMKSKDIIVIDGYEAHPNDSYHLSTMSYEFFRNMRFRWYDENGKKRVPRDIRFTPVMLANWIMGDGSLSVSTRKNGLNYYYYELATNSFSKEDVEFLRDKFNELGFHFIMHKQKRNSGYYTLRLMRQCDVLRFAWLIEPYIVSCFRYKVRCLDDDDWLNKWEGRCSD